MEQDNVRQPVADMTDREIAEETLESVRAVLDVFRALASHPMAAAMMPPAMRQ
jgi:hypothetical protein